MKTLTKKLATILTLILVLNVIATTIISEKAFANNLPKINSLSVLETSPKKGDRVTFRVASKGSELVEYSIFLYSPTKKVWENVSGGYSKPVKQGQIHSINITKGLNSGDNNFSIWVKRAGKPPANKGGYDDFKSFTVKVKSPSTEGGNSSKPASIKSASILAADQFVGKYPSLKLSANSSVKVQYRVFLYSKDSRKWEDVTGGYTAPTSPSVTTNIKLSKPLHKGENVFSIWVKRGDHAPANKNGYDGFYRYVVNAKESGSIGESLPANINTVTIDKAQQKLGGTPSITLTAKATTKVEYAVYMYSKSMGTWEDVSGGYSSPVDPREPKTIKINKTLKPGDNVISIWVKRAGQKPSNKGGYDNFTQRTVNIGTSPSTGVKISSINIDESQAVYGNRPDITVKAASGNRDEIKYKAFLYSNKKKQWVEASEFSTSTTSGESRTLSLTTPLESGYNKIQVWAKKESTLGEVYEDFKTIEVYVNRPSPMKKLIVLDAGHGGKDSGAVSVSGTKEKDITLLVALKTGKILESKGYDVLYTRENDNVNWNSSIQSESLRYRYTFANSKRADLFISVHCNAGGGTGIETYYSKKYPSKDMTLAKNIQYELIKETGMVDRRAKAGSLAVVNNTTMPASLVEIGFIDNIRDEVKLRDPMYQNQCAEAMVRGILKSINN
ncbi:MAG: N-acetylmuramoyl-L-alanine amidase [Clostridium sp.]